ncbi:MAG: hypothetical protein RSA29_13535 [Clostridium sp.]|uniref:hypothetical protein n=1 Tax=Clostridium sp. TaxID=1506 RepID=UPI00304D5621
MATWVAHLRVAEKVLNSVEGLDEIPFVVGNIGPDSGIPNEDWSNFDPPKKITHWLDELNKTNAENFFKSYIKDNKNIFDSNSNNNSLINIIKSEESYSFKLGYYVHLLTDMEWSKMINAGDYPYKEVLKKEPGFIWTIKKDWYGLDFLYLEKHPKFIFNTIFKEINDVPNYLDYFPKDAFTKQVKYITSYYLGKNEETKENFKYLTEVEMNEFIDKTSMKIIEKLLNVTELKKKKNK